MATEMTEQQRATAIQKITQRNYTEEIVYNEDKTARVSIYHDHGMFSESTIKNFLSLSKRIGKEVCLLSWANHNAIEYVKEKFGKRKKVYFFLFGEPELEPCFSAPFNVDQERTRKFTSEGTTKVHKYWNHDCQFKQWQDYFSTFDIAGQGSGCSFDGSIYHARIYKNVTIMLTSFLMCQCPEEMSKYAIQELINCAYTTMKMARVRKNYEKLATNFMEQYKNFSLQALKATPRTLEYKLSDLLERMRANFVAINNCEREIEVNKALLNSAQANVANFEAFYAKETANIKTVLMSSFKTKFKDFGFNGTDEIHAITKPIYVELIIPTEKGGDGVTLRRFLLGEYKISIRINDSYVTLHNLCNTSNNSDYDHPHVRDSRPCLGNLKEEVPKLIRQSDFLAVFLLMYDYLKSINPFGWYRTVTAWQEIPLVAERSAGSIEDDEDEEEETNIANQAQAVTAEA